MVAQLQQLAEVLPLRDIDEAIDHYRSLGFAVRAYEGDAPYGFAERDGVHLHLAQVSGLDPATNPCSVYLYVDDADALHGQWSEAGVRGRLIAPVDAEYGLREGAHVDPDGNLLRFGSPLQ
jgi:hypothetical protein